MIVYAHRGLHGAHAPENTMAAFHAAAAGGWGIESDLRLDADGEIILFHDRVVGDTPVDRLTRRALEGAVGYPVPTLTDLLAADLRVPLNLEVKTAAAFEAAVPHLARLPADVLVSSFVHAIPAAIAARHGIESALLLASAPLDLPAPRPHLRTIVWDFNMASAATLAAATGRGWRTIVYGARTADEHAFLRASGIAAIITDTPDRA